MLLHALSPDIFVVGNAYSVEDVIFDGFCCCELIVLKKPSYRLLNYGILYTKVIFLKGKVMPIPSSKPFQKQTAKDKAYEQIKDWIVNGTLMPEEKLAEVELAQSIAVSRTPIREALLRLNEEGLVVIAAGKITRVAPIDADNIADLFEPMAVIEGLAANQAASRIDEASFKKLANLEKKYRVSLNSNKLTTILKADRVFHQQILAIADNDYETKFSNQLYNHIYRYELSMIKLLDADHQNFKITTNHEALLKALAEQNPVKASATMTKDWLSTLKKVVSIQELTEASE